MAEHPDGFHRGAFVQASAESDAEFFTRHGMDSLMDMGARTAVTALYQTVLPAAGRVLDLMAGALSHLPKEVSLREVVGIDVSKTALEANAALNRRIEQNLNADPRLPFEDESFDAVLLCDGLAYLTQPLAALEEAWRVLKPGAPLVVTFSDRFHAAKAVALWQALEPEDRSRLVGILLSRAGFAELDTGEVVPPEDLTAWRDTVHAVIGRRPRG